MPPRDLKVFMVLMKKATWVTAKIKDEYQPRSLEELARWAHMSEANLKRSLNHLQRHGWIQRYRYLGSKGIGGRGHPTHYQLDHGRDCDCKAHKGAQDEPVSRAKGAQKCPIKGLKSEDITAGQTPVSAKSVREEEGVERRTGFVPVWALPRPAPDESWKSWPAGSIGEEMNR